MGKPYNIEIGKRFGSLIVLKEVEATHFVKNKYPFKAEKEYFGEFAPQKYLFKEYGIVED